MRTPHEGPSAAFAPIPVSNPKGPPSLNIAPPPSAANATWGYTQARRMRPHGGAGTEAPSGPSCAAADPYTNNEPTTPTRTASLREDMPAAVQLEHHGRKAANAPERL